MNTKTILSLANSLLTVALCISAAGCASSRSTGARPLKPTVGAHVDLSKYRQATVLQFETERNKKIDPSIGSKFADEVAVRLQNDFGKLFEDVRKTSPAGHADEVIVTGVIKAYQPGNRFARGMLIGLGAASFKGDLVLKDGSDNRVIFVAPFDKIWAWGGYLGMSKGIEEIWTETAAAVASTVAQAEGWKPEPKSLETK